MQTMKSRSLPELKQPEVLDCDIEFKWSQRGKNLLIQAARVATGGNLSEYCRQVLYHDASQRVSSSIAA